MPNIVDVSNALIGQVNDLLSINIIEHVILIMIRDGLEDSIIIVIFILDSNICPSIHRRGDIGLILDLCLDFCFHFGLHLCLGSTV
jgi:hypothetical protein